MSEDNKVSPELPCSCEESIALRARVQALEEALTEAIKGSVPRELLCEECASWTIDDASASLKPSTAQLAPTRVDSQRLLLLEEEAKRG